ncbi:MAG: TetR/AcrR family transcriptional regulator [Hyphomicrobiaceae bacterium]|nr:MAG: TetR/AcrR family transcriptional regulator [Hyphomicrobiaceae bacterium]
MARRPQHSPDQLRLMIVDAAEKIIREGGLGELSAREIARLIKYSPGTIYNVFTTIDDVVLEIEQRVLKRLDSRLHAVKGGPSPDAELRRLADAYVDFTHGDARLWSVLAEHRLRPRAVLPEWYDELLRRLLDRIEAALVPAFPIERQRERRQSARALFASLHGVTSLSSAGKLPIVTPEETRGLLQDLMSTYLAGTSRRSRPRGRQSGK